jgi:hypothetical protein
MINNASNLILRTRPYIDIQTLYEVRIVDPSYTYLSLDTQYTVRGEHIPRRYNKFIPSIAPNHEGQLIIVMEVTVDLSPKYDVIEVDTLLTPKRDENSPPKRTPVSSRLGPPVKRSFHSHKRYRPRQTPEARATPEPRSSPERRSSQQHPKSRHQPASLLKNRQPLKPRSLNF